MKKNMIKYGFLSLLLATSLVGCSDFMDNEQRGVTTVDNFYKTDAEVTEGLYAIYNRVQGDDLAQFRFKNLLSDECVGSGGSRGDDSQGEQIAEFRFDADNTMISTMFTHYYRIIYNCNLLMERTTADDEVKTIAIAEAKAFRAYAYFELVTLWGPVPLVTQTLAAGNYAQPNSTVDAIWTQIEKDLTEAIADLPLKSQRSATLKGNVCKGTAQAWLGKAYLYQKKYSEAAKMFDVVINSGEYALVSDFSTISKEAGEFSSESLFEISYTNDLTVLTEGTSMVAYCGPRSPWFKAGTSGISETAWGWCGPSPESYKAFTEAGDTYRRNNTVINEQELISKYGGSLRQNGNLPYNNEGYVAFKYGSWVSETKGEAYHTVAGTNFRLLRYADVLLMAAEAYNRMSPADDQKALNYINQVRKRAQMPDLTSTGDKLFADIKTERRLELCYEFVRFQDLIRWGDAETVLKDKGKLVPRGDGTYIENADAGFKERNKLLPFPYTEVSVNPNIQQNPGY